MMPDETRPVLTRGEKIFVGGFAVFTFAVSLGFVIATVGWSLAFPGVFVAIALGICIASIVYAFLGGVAGAEFSAVAGMKVAGSLAAIAIVYYLISGPLENSMNDAHAIAAGKAAESTIQEEHQRTVSEHAARLSAEQKVRELQSEAGIQQSDSDAAVLARIRQSTLDDDLGRGVLGIYRNRQGPFRSNTIKLQARFIQDVPDGTFRFCHDRRPDLQDKQVQFEIVDPETGASKKIQLRAGGDIGPGACQVIKFDVQLGCDAAKDLLQLDCDDQRGVAWPASSGNRIYELVATVMNPDFG
jgi:hypothetical protein